VALRPEEGGHGISCTQIVTSVHEIREGKKLFFLIGKTNHKAASKSQHAQNFVILYLYFHARYINAQIAYYTIRINEIIYKGNYAFLN